MFLAANVVPKTGPDYIRYLPARHTSSYHLSFADHLVAFGSKLRRENFIYLEAKIGPKNGP